MGCRSGQADGGHFGYDVLEIGLHVNLSILFCFALHKRVLG